MFPFDARSVSLQTSTNASGVKTTATQMPIVLTTQALTAASAELDTVEMEELARV